MAHSFIMNYDSEEEAFQKFCRVFPSNRALLLDTYDTIEGAKKAVSSEVKPMLVRLDSGDRYALSRKVRQILDVAGLRDTEIFASGDLNENALDDLTSRNAPIDSFAVGTELVTSRDDPALSAIYKLVAVEKGGETALRVKTSEGKRTIPGAKQVYRRLSENGKIQRDILALENERQPEGTIPLMVKVMKGGEMIQAMPQLRFIQEHARKEVASLPPKFRNLTGSRKPPLGLSPRLRELTKSMWRGRV
jgi:nicotinate phosphoribosyltransferase